MRRASLVGILAAAVLATGSLVEVDRVSDPQAAFARAWADAARVEGRPGAPERLEVLVWLR